MFIKKRMSIVISSLFLSLTFGNAYAAEPARPASVAPQEQQLEFDVILPLQNEAELDQLLAQQRDASSPNFQHWLTPQEFKSRYGANADSLARVVHHLQSNGLSIVREHAQGVRVRGGVSAVSAALGVSMEEHRVGGVRRMQARHGQVIRAELRNEGAVVTAVGPAVSHQVHSVNLGKVPTNRYSPYGSYWFTDIKQAYDFPAYPALTGAGATVAIVMGSDYLDTDVANFFNHEKFTAVSGAPIPTIVRIPVLGGGAFDPNNGSSFEVSLDIQQVGGMAPGATIELYYTPDLQDSSIMAAYVQIVNDNTADIVSSSFGLTEDAYTAAYNSGIDYTSILTAYDQVFKQGNAQGITFVASSGDSGGLATPSLDYLSGSKTATFVPGVQHPAVSPNVTGVGGTNLQTVTGQWLDATYVGENAFGDPEVPYDPWGVGVTVSGGYWGSGGGVSKIFAQPSYQKLVPTGSQMRTVPDVSLMEGGCPGGLAVTPCATNRSSAVLAFAGSFYGVIGTSVSAPEFAGALALAVQHGGHRLGNVNTLLYQKALLQSHHIGAPVYRTNIQGFNGAEYTAPIYNQVIGLGTPDIRALIGATSIAPAGIPQTATNP
jgi:subtilase family serine protease